MRILPMALIAALCAPGVARAGEAFTIIDAIKQAVQTNPAVGEASANRRATEADMHQSQGALLPQVRLDVRAGPERFDQQDISPSPQGNNTWLPGRTAALTLRQTLFDGFASLNEIWRQAARVDAASYRVHERSELIALDAAEAYIDVVRYGHLIKIADDNVRVHRRLLGNVQARYSGGRAGEGDLQEVRERVAAAEAARAEFVQSLENARAAYRKAVGLEPYNVRPPGRLRGLPETRDAALAVALQYNPTIRAAQADADAAKYAFHGTTGGFLPNVSLEARTLRGADADMIYGYRTEQSGKVVLSWDLFNGGQNGWKREAAAERYTEAAMAHAKLQRAAFESLDKAWAARTITADRVAALLRQVDADRKAITAYEKEYELGQRSLIDLLNAENQLYVGLVSLESARGVAVFADYQLLAAMGQLLAYLKSPTPEEAAPLARLPLGIFPMRVAPLNLRLPKTGSEPLNVATPSGSSPDGTTLLDRWPKWSMAPNTTAGAAPGVAQAAPAQAIGPAWPGSSASALSFSNEMLKAPIFSITPGKSN
ncbi:MAG TPA: TolC family outer membrane protein [Xanthobacteraceae bacterium]|nr:TolC family outer membrane protein [Xanthobacteraceae bacterium]